MRQQLNADLQKDRKNRDVSRRTKPDLTKGLMSVLDRRTRYRHPADVDRKPKT